MSAKEETIEVKTEAAEDAKTTVTIVKASASTEEMDLTTKSDGAAAASATPTIVAAEPDQQHQQHIYIIQTSDGAIPVESAEVVVADDMAVYETVSALEQLSRGQVVTTAADGEQLIQVGGGQGTLLTCYSSLGMLRSMQYTKRSYAVFRSTISRLSVGRQTGNF